VRLRPLVRRRRLVEATTWARVAELDEMQAAALAAAFPESPRVAGWPGLPLERRARILWQEIEDLGVLIGHLPAGACDHDAAHPRRR
jgi:hypothetical protein